MNSLIDRRYAASKGTDTKRLRKEPTSGAPSLSASTGPTRQDNPKIAARLAAGALQSRDSVTRSTRKV